MEAFMTRAILTLFLIFTASSAFAVGAPVRIDGGDTIIAQNDATVSTTAVLVASSNSSRASLNCTTTENVRWGHSGVLATKGQLLPANGSIAITNTASVYMIAESTDATVSCTEESWASVSSGGGIFSP
jgi:hypothetical protein